MKHALALLAALAACTASAIRAEKLDLDHRLYPPLHAAMENPHDGTIFYDASKPGRVFDRILIRGSSAERDWTEALELLVTRREGRIRTPQDWLAAFRPETESPCPVKFDQLAVDTFSLTFALAADPCPAGPGLTGLYRVVLGRKSVYLVGAKLKGIMTKEQQQQWLALLNSASLSD